jgi:hypothetical protein
LLVEQFTTAAAAVRTVAELDNVARLSWRALSEGHLSEADAEAVSGAVEARRAAFRAVAARVAIPAPSARRKPPVSPDKRLSLERRRTMAASGQLPPAIAARFTLAEQAALAVIARICRRARKCDAPIDKIAALAGVSRSTVKNALREARRLGFLAVTHRPRRGMKSDTNVIEVLAREWLAWLQLSSPEAHRGQNAAHHEYTFYSDTKLSGKAAVKRERTLTTGSRSTHIYGHGRRKFAHSKTA